MTMGSFPPVDVFSGHGQMTTSGSLYFDDVKIGEEWESPGRTITEADIVNFAGVSGDYNPIHIDHEFAKTTPFRRPIAHGLLGLAASSGLGYACPPMRTVAFLSLREWLFKGPVFIGDTIRVKTRIVNMELRGRGKRGEIVWQRAILNQDNQIVQEGVSVTLVEARRLPRAEN